MFEPGKKALIKYCFDSMLTAAHVFAFAEQEGYSGPRTTASKDLLIQRISKDKGCLLTVRALQSYCRKHWVNPPTAIHLANLKSGKLKGHSWNGAFPKTVHDRLQRFARMVCAGELALDEYLAMGDQIVAHEYFMVAIADLCEGLIIDHFDAFPPLMTRSVSDFVLNGMPYDLKCTSPTKEWPFARIVKDPIGYARGMFGGGSEGRLRLEADGSVNNWANNRLFVVVESETDWESRPEKVLGRLKRLVGDLGEPLKVRVAKSIIRCQVVPISL